MNMKLVRKWFTDQSTIGELSIDGKFECFTLEDVVRDVKIQKETAIPAGTYEVIVNYSNRYEKDMPLLLGVTGFTGIRIHPGNTKKDTEGCILVGQTRGKDEVLKSRKAFTALFKKLKEAIAENQRVVITVISND